MSGILNFSYTQAQTVFAVIGDFGSDSGHETAVANLVDSWNPDFVVTVGDNNYTTSTNPLTYSQVVGKYYHQYMFPHDPDYGNANDPSSNHFWPILGNHDYINGSYSDYTNYFTLPNDNGERYYTKQIGDIEFFAINSDTHEPDGTNSSSKQAQWIQQQISNSTATWKIVLFHHPAYSSGGSNSRMRWPFENWGVDAVISGHVHNYERIFRDDNNDNKNLVYFVDGLGGESKKSFGSSFVSGSQAHYSSDYGALKVTESGTTLKFQFYNTSGTEIDHYTIDKTTTPNNPPLAASKPSPADVATGVSTSPTLSWSDSDPDGDALTYDIYFGTNSTPSTVVSSAQSGKTYSLSGLSNSTTYYWQIIAKDTKGATTDGPVWTFTTAPNSPPVAASNPNPLDNATGVSLSPTLSWSCTDPDGDALTYDVYFGTNSNPTNAVSSGQSETTFSQSGLSAGVIYFWKVVATDTKGATTDGPVWSFTTVAPTPVELMAFSAKLVNGFTVQLNWSTVTEVNNYGFDIERSSDKNSWQKIGFVSGSGNSNSPKNYSFTDNPTGGSAFNYRLKQIDVGGAFKYYDPVSINLAASDQPQLLQNSPNPFNPSTAIKFYTPNASNVIIKIYNILGREIKTLLDEQIGAGYHVVYWNGRNSRGEEVSSGIYLYRLTAGSFSQTKKMNLLK